MIEETSIETKQSIVEPAVSVEQFVEKMKRFHEFKMKSLTKEDIVTIQNKAYIKRSGWRKIALAFNISDEIMQEHKQEYEDHYVWRITVKANASNGRYAVGIGACSSNEKKFQHGEHDVYAIAHTRAKNRAISDLVGSGEVSAEEILGLEQSNTNAESTIKNETEQTSKSDLSHIIKWTVKNVDFPIDINTGPYHFLSEKVMRPLTNKHGILFFEELTGDHLIAIRTSDMDSAQYEEIEKALSWVLIKVGNCQKEDVKVFVES